MADSSKKRKATIITPEVIIVMFIAVCIIFLMQFADNKLDELIISDTETLFMGPNHNPDDMMHQDLANQIARFRPDSCKMIEIYDENFIPIVRVQFQDEQEYNGNITDHPDLINLLNNNEDGHTSLELDGNTEYIYFKWSESFEGDRYLFIIYTYKPIVKNFWIFHAVCYTILFLTCVLMLRLVIKNRHDQIRYYEEISSIYNDSLTE